MKKTLYSLMVAMTAMTATAQETYESATVTDQDLNGTARYVGMGGAMDALGADISTISSNPAGIGLFRRSQATLSAGAQIISGQPTDSRLGANSTTASFDQVGFVIASRSNYDSYFNFAFNYHKSKNFNQILSAVGSLDRASQNKNAFIEGPDFYSRISMLYNTAVNGQYIEGKKNDYYDITDYYNATGFDMLRSSEGYIGNFDFNLSGNIDNCIYLGATVGIKTVHYKASSSYVEKMAVGGDIEVLDERRVHGSGFDVTLGAIFRPIETSPFRIGLTIASPTFYSLTTENSTALYNNMPETINGVPTEYGYHSEAHDAGISYDFTVYTPWRFGLSAAHTVGNFLALGAGIDYSDYSFLSNRINKTGRSSIWYDEGFTETSDPDRIMNEHTKHTLKGVATVKVGAEYKPAENFAVRMGYNYITPKYKMSGAKDLMLDSYGSDCASQTDYTNWKATNRLTFGIGFTQNNFTFDLAYQYSNVKGEFHPFIDSTVDVKNIKYVADYMKADIIKNPAGDYIPNYADAVNVSNTRHQLLMTIGYRF